MAFPQDTTFVIIGGNKSPGIASFPQTPSRRFKYDNKSPRGRGGDYSVATGEGTSDFSVQFELYNEDDLGAYEAFANVLDLAKKSDALDIVHPLLAHRQIFSVQVLEVGAPGEGRENGPNVAVCKFRKFVAAPPKQLGRAKGSGKTPKKPLPLSDLDIKIAARLKTEAEESKIPR